MGKMATVNGDEVLKGLESDNFDSLNVWCRTYSINSTFKKGSTLLSIAIRKSKARAIFNLIKRGADVNQRETLGATPLLLAIHLNRFEVVQHLVRSGANIKIEDYYFTPLTAAVCGGKLDMIEFLIDSGADATACDLRGLPPLFHAIRERKLAIIDLFLRKGVGKVVDSAKNTPLIAAIKEGFIDVVECLLDSDFDVNETKNEKTPLAWAAGKGNLEIVKILLAKGANINMLGADGNTALATAVRYKQTDVIKYLTCEGAKICKVANNGRTPLLWAVLNEDLDTIKWLLDNGAEYIIDSVLLDAIATKNMEVVKLLKEREVLGVDKITPLQKTIHVEKDLERKGISTAINLIVSHKIELLKLLIESCVKLDVLGDCGRTLLTEAISVEDFEIIKYLVAQGAKISQPKGSGLTPLAIALSPKTKNVEIAKYLIDSGAKVVDDLGGREIPAAMQLLEKNKIEMFKLLVENGARLDEFGDCGQTLLTKVISAEDFKIVKYLIAQGANVNQPNREGLTPLEIAESNNDFEIFQYLVDCGATVGLEETKNFKLSKSYQIANSLKRRKLDDEMSSNQEAAQN